MRAIILAAGRGSRMGGLTRDLPKCRTIFRGKSLVEWQMEALKAAGITEIAIVRGYRGETFDFDVTYFDNERWNETNMVMSLVMAESWLKEDVCIVSYSDIVYSSDAVNRLLSSNGDIVITFDPNWLQLWKLRFEDPLLDAETFKLDNDKVIEIGNRAKEIGEIEGQYMGLLKFTPKGWDIVKAHLACLVQSDQDRLDMTALLKGLILENNVIRAVSISDRWYEIDSENDIVAYESSDW